jgi:hypothetical protein
MFVFRGCIWLGFLRTGSQHRDRLFIVDPPTRNFLLRYTNRLGMSNNKRRLPFTAPEAPALEASISRHAPFILLWFTELQGAAMLNNPARTHHLEFLAELCYNTSVDGGLFKGASHVLPVLRSLSTGASVSFTDSKVLERYFPALSRLLHMDASLGSGLPAFLRPTILQLIAVGDNLRNVPPQECMQQPNVQWRPVDADEDLKIGWCYPPVHEQRDSNSYTRATRRSDLDSRAGGCRKATHKFVRVMPGVFAVFCPHGICLGFHFMSNFESPETFFSLMMQRRRQMPKVVLYDNDCHLHSYAMNREPWHFRQTEMYIDRMHFWCGHVGCSIGFCIERIPFFNALNTEVAEQGFSVVDRITTPVAFMGVENATRFVRIFLALQNQDRRREWAAAFSPHANARAQRMAVKLTAIDDMMRQL